MVRASKAKGAKQFSECSDALNDPERRDAANCVGRNSPCPRWFRQRDATRDLARGGDDGED